MRVPRFLTRKSTWASVAGTAVIVGGVGLAIGPLAGWVVDHGGDGRRVWRLGTLKIEGVRGSWLGDLTAEHITIEDEEGVWLEGFNVSLDWRPLDLLGGTVRIDAAQAESIIVSRRPILLDRTPSAGARLDVRLDQARIGSLTIDEAAFGAGGTFALDFGLDYIDKTIERVDLALTRSDSDADRAIARYSGLDYALHVDVASAEGGVLAHILGVGDQGVTLTADGEGSMATGAAIFAGRVGDEPLLDGAMRWRSGGWTLEAQGRLDVLEPTRTIGRRLGSPVAITASGTTPGRFNAHTETPFLALDIEGVLDEEMALAEPARVTARTARLSNVAREAPFELGAATFEGELTRDSGVINVTGTFDALENDILGRSVRMSGPVRAELNRARFEMQSTLTAAPNSPALFANAVLETTLDYDRSSGRFTLSRAQLRGDALAIDARGSTNDGAGEFSGNWRLRQMQAVFPDLRGGAAGRWRALASERRDGERIWTATIDGDGENLSGRPDVVPQLLGRNPTLDAMVRIEDGGVTVSHARINGPKLRAGATGRIVGGNANLRLEASARGPIDMESVRVSGAVDATGQLTGRLAQPTLELQAQLASVAASGVIIDQPLINLTLAPRGRAYAGDVRLAGAINGQPLTAESPIEIANNAVSFPDLVAHAGGLNATGSVTLANAGPRADLSLAGSITGLAPGVSGKVLGDVALTPEIVRIDVQLADARSGDLRIRAATFSGEGPWDAIASTFTIRGRANHAPLAFDGRGLVSIEDGFGATFEGTGALAESEIATRSPITYTQRGDERAVTFDLSMDDGAIRGEWRERGRSLSGSAVIEDAPIAPLVAIANERATGHIDGNFRIESQGDGLAGEADLHFIDARVAGRQQGSLTSHFRARLTPTRLITDIDARSSDGLEAQLHADAPVITSAAPILIAIAPERRGTATWSIDGPVEALFAAARLPDQALEGDVIGAGEVQFGSGYLAGDGRVEIANGRFEDKVTGVKLEALNAALVVHEEGVRIERFSATDGNGGRVTATGGSASANEGRVAIELTNFKLVDRPDAEARANGAIALEWEGMQSSVSGDINIVQANVSLAGRPEENIPQLDVIEINRPGFEDETEVDDVPRQRFRTDLNINVTAPGRVFTRGRGIEAEWALDARVGGTLAQPLVYGEARAIRGTIQLSGQPFVIDEGVITLRGSPENASIDLSAVRTTADLTATMNLNGDVTDPEITFTSDPPLPEDEILPQILFGRSVADLSALEAAQLASSLAALSGQASFNLVDAARSVVGLDRFAVRQDEGGGVLVSGGVYLTSDVYVEVARTGLGQAQTRVEWIIRPQLVLVTSFLPNGDQRVSVRWRRETD